MSTGVSNQHEGLFRVKLESGAYVFSRFQPSFARRVFPGFDRPDLRTPIALSLGVPEGMIAVASTSVANIEETDALRWFHFKETRAIPLHLLGLAVGPFEVVDAPAATIGETPLRMLTTAGKSHLTAYAMDQVPEIFSAAADYFDVSIRMRSSTLWRSIFIGALEQQDDFHARVTLARRPRIYTLEPRAVEGSFGARVGSHLIGSGFRHRNGRSAGFRVLRHLLEQAVDLDGPEGCHPS